MKVMKSYSFEEDLHTRIRIMAATYKTNLNDLIDMALDALFIEKEKTQ